VVQVLQLKKWQAGYSGKGPDNPPPCEMSEKTAKDFGRRQPDTGPDNPARVRIIRLFSKNSEKWLRTWLGVTHIWG
jgi:hypothetical protein